MDDLSEQIRWLEESLLNPQVRKSADALDALLGDEFVEFGSSGRIYDKSQVLESLPQESGEIISLTDFQLTPLGPEHVMATYKSARYTHQDERPAFALRCSIWRLDEGRWQMIFHQGTPSSSD